MKSLHWVDILTIVLYFILCLGVGLWSSCKSNTGSVKGYFLAGRNMIWLPVGASVFATNVGSHFFIGMAGSAAANGIGVVAYEWHAVFIFILLGGVFIPVYASSQAYTMPEYLKKRFGGRRLRMMMSIIAIFKIVIKDASTAMYTGAIFIEQSVGWDLYSSITTVIVITALYTLLGGLTAVIWADTMQTAIMLIGSLYMTVTAFSEVGGYNGLRQKYMDAVPNVTTCGNITAGYPREDSFHIFRDPVNSDIPWPGVIFGLTPMAIFAWCNDQVSVQRLLAAKTHSHVKGGLIFAGYLKILPFVIVILPGMISRVLFPDEIACVNPDICRRVCDDANGCSNIAYPLLVLRILPTGIRGLLLAVMFSALMSTLTSIFNSASTLFTVDLYARLRKSASVRELMIASRIFIIFLTCVSIAWIPILKAAQGGQLWNYLQAIVASLVPPWCIVFLLGILWQRTTEPGAFWGLVTGLTTGVSRMILDFANPKPPCGEEETRPPVLYKVHFLYFAVIVSAVTFIVSVIVSLLTTPRPKEKIMHAICFFSFYCKLNRVTWWTRNSEEPRVDSDDEDDLDDKYGDQTKTGSIKEELEQSSKNEAFQKSVKRNPVFNRVYNLVCCYPSFQTTPKTPERGERERRKYRGDEEPYWIKTALDINAIILVTFAAFLFGFFH